MELDRETHIMRFISLLKYTNILHISYSLNLIRCQYYHSNKDCETGCIKRIVPDM